MADKPPIDWDNQPQQAASSSKPPIDWDTQPAPEKSMGQQLWDGVSGYAGRTAHHAWDTVKGLGELANGAVDFAGRTGSGQVSIPEMADRGVTFARGIGDSALAMGETAFDSTLRATGAIPRNANTSKLATQVIGAGTDLASKIPAAISRSAHGVMDKGLSGASDGLSAFSDPNVGVDYNTWMKQADQADQAYPGARMGGQLVPQIALAARLGGFSSLPRLMATAGLQSMASQAADKGANNIDLETASQDALLAGGTDFALSAAPKVYGAAKAGAQSVGPAVRAGVAGTKEWAAGRSIDSLANSMDSAGSPAIQGAGKTLKTLNGPEGTADFEAIARGGEQQYQGAVQQAKVAEQAFNELDGRIQSEFKGQVGEATSAKQAQLDATHEAQSGELDRFATTSKQTSAENLASNAKGYYDEIQDQKKVLGDARQTIYREFSDEVPPESEQGFVQLVDTVNNLNRLLQENDGKAIAAQLNEKISNRLDSLLGPEIINPDKSITRGKLDLTAGQALQVLTDINTSINEVRTNNWGDSWSKALSELSETVNTHIDHLEASVAPHYGAEVPNQLRQIRATYSRIYDAEGVLKHTLMQRAPDISPSGKVMDTYVADPAKSIGQLQSATNADNLIPAISRMEGQVPGSRALGRQMEVARASSGQKVSPLPAPKLTPQDTGAIATDVRSQNPELNFQLNRSENVKNSAPFQHSPFRPQDHLERGAVVTKDGFLPGVDTGAHSQINQALDFQPTMDKIDTVRDGQKEFNSTIGPDPTEKGPLSYVPFAKQVKKVGDALGLGVTREDAVALLRQKAEAARSRASAIDQLRETYRGKPVADTVQRVINETGGPLNEGMVDKLARLYSVDPIPFRRALISLGLALDGQ